MIRATLYLLCASVLPTVGFAQTADVADHLRLSATGQDAKLIEVPSGQMDDSTAFQVEAGTGTIVANATSSCAVITLVPPSGAEVTEANATGQGYTFGRITVSSESAIVLGPAGLPGETWRFGLPESAVSGAYRVKVNATACSYTVVVNSTYLSPSRVQLAAISPTLPVNPGTEVDIAGILLDSGAPLTGGTVKAKIWAVYDVTPQVSFTNIRQVAARSIDSETTEVEYALDATNSGTPLEGVIGRPGTSNEQILITTPGVAFGTMDTASTVSSGTTLIIRRPNGVSFDPSSITWTAEAMGAPVLLNLTDEHRTPNDGIYSATSRAQAERWSIR
jgi:hypothetical protein